MASDTAFASPLPGWFASLERRFDLRSELGRGRHKQVYLAWDRSLERQVAIASIDATHLDSAAASRLREARAMARIGDHPRIVSVYDVIELNDLILIVSQFVSGGDLRSRLDGAGELLPAPWCVGIAADVAEALGHAHDSRMIHRDVKPGNVLLDAGDRALLGDLGLSEILSESRGDEWSGVQGSLPYVSPEQLLGEQAGSPSDTYSLGCVLYEMLAGFPPFRAESAAELVSNIVGAHPGPLREARPDLPPVLEDVVMQCLDKDPAKRPTSCRELAEVLRTIRGYSLRDRTASGTRERDRSPESVPVFGFDANLKIIAKATSDLCAGTPGVLLVEGEAGTGKSRLLRELTGTAESKGCTVLQANASDAGYLPLQPIATALRPLLTRIPERGPISGLRKLIDGDTEPASAPGLGTSQDTGWFAAVTMLLDEVASDRPVVLSIDDLHAADSASISVLQHLMNHLAQPGAPPLLIAIAARASASPELVERMQRLRNAAIATRISLDRLTDRAIRQIIEARGVSSPSAQLVRHVESVSGCNPRLVHEVLSSLLAAGAIERQGGFSVARPDFVAADQQGTIGAFVASKVKRLPAKCREALQVLSAFGTTASTAAIAAILGADIDDVRSCLDAAIADELVFQEFDRYRFAYLDLKQAVYSAIPESDREATHFAIARYLRSLDPDDGDFSLASVAAHLLRAGTRSDPEELIRTCSDAASTAMHRFAWAEAASLLETALSKARETENFPRSTLAELHRRAGIAHFHLYDKGPSIHHLDLAIDILRDCDDHRALIVALNDRARAAIQSGMVAYGELQSVEPLERTLASLRDEDENLTAVVLGTLAESYWNAQQTERATELAEEALSIARDNENARLVAEMCIHRALAHLQSLELREALEIYEEGIEAARSASHLTALEQCLTRHSMVSLLLGKTAASEAAAVEAQRLNRITHSGDESWSHSTLTTLALIRGDHEAVETQAEEGIELLRRAKYPWSAAVLLVTLAGSRAYRGEADAARRAIALLLEPGFVLEDVSPLEAYSQQHLALIAAYSGEPARPVEFFDLASQINIDAGYDFALLPVFCAAIELWGLGRAPQPPPATVRAIELAYNRGALFSVGWPFFVPRMLAVAALTEGDLGEAVRYGQKALDVARRIRAAPEIARSALDLARALRLRGQDGDHARADKLLDKQRPVIDLHCPPGLRGKLLPAIQDHESPPVRDRYVSSSR